MKNKRYTVYRHLFLGSLSLVLLVPFYLAVVNAFKPRALITGNPMGLPFSELTFHNITNAAFTSSFNILTAYGTSILISTGSIVTVILIGSMMAYVIARNDNMPLKVLYLLLLAGMMIPPQIILLPLVQILSALGLMFRPEGLILHNIGWYLPFAVFVYSGFIRTLSTELDQSAYMDGANTMTIFWKIIFPLLKPCTATAVIFLFLWTWNDFLNPLIILGSTRGYTVTTGIYMAIGQYNTNWDEVFALVFLASFPIFILYVCMQRFFISGITEGSLKG